MKKPPSWVLGGITRMQHSRTLESNEEATPSLLSGIKDDTNDLKYSFQILGDDTLWNAIAKNAGISDLSSYHARLALERIIMNVHRNCGGEMLPNKARRKLKKLAMNASKLVADIAEDCEHGVFWSALFEAGIHSNNEKTVLGWDMDADLILYLESVTRLQAWLAKAKNHVREGTRGPDDNLRQLISSLYQWQLDFGGKGLVRASVQSKRGGNATRHFSFVESVVKLAGLEPKAGAIDDAMKDEITKRNGGMG